MKTTVATSLRFVSQYWKGDIVGVPALIMAVGIFLLYPGKYLAGVFFEPSIGHMLLDGLSVCLSIFAAYAAVRFAAQLRLDVRVLWSSTVNHFRIGTWVAGVNILAVLLFSLSPTAGLVAHVAGWLLWILYMGWLVRMVFMGELKRSALNGTAFLTTVATQSLVTSFMIVWAASVEAFLAVLILLNVLGIVFYWISFALTWVVGGFLEPLANWVPQNNITHGALSITMLAAQMIEERIPGSLPYFHLVIQAAWVTTSVLFVSSLLFELYLTVKKKKPLLEFQFGNYARNFTYGMFFACSLYGYISSSPSIMKTVLHPTTLVALAMLVLVVNLWELGHQAFIVLGRRSRLQVAV